MLTTFKVLKEIIDPKQDIVYILFCLLYNDLPIDIFLTTSHKTDTIYPKLNDQFVYCMREIDPDFRNPSEFDDMELNELSINITRKTVSNGILEKHQYLIPIYKC